MAARREVSKAKKWRVSSLIRSIKRYTYINGVKIISRNAVKRSFSSINVHGHLPEGMVLEFEDGVKVRITVERIDNGRAV